MWVIFVEAGTALFLFVFIVWWTMFSGKKPNTPQETPTDTLSENGSGEANEAKR
jgi:hypothetical protein